MSLLKDFKDFAAKGNMVDMAVGFVLGAAFGTVIKSLVSDVLMPVVSKIFFVPDFKNLFFVLRNPENIPEGLDIATLEGFRKAGGLALAWGNFVNNLIAFIIIAFALWIVVRSINKMKKATEKAKEEAKPAPVGPTEIDLLTEIRDSLKK